MQAGILVIVLAVASLQDAQPCDSCVAEPKRVVLCAQHAESEEEVLAAQSERLRSDDTQARIAALDDIAALTSQHPNAPSEAVARALAEGLEDGDPSVRLRAAELLGAGQNPVVAMPALLKSLRTVDRDIEAEHARIGKVLDDLERRNEKFLKDPKKGFDAADLKELADGFTEASQLQDTLLPLCRVERAIVRSLASYPDDRSVKALKAGARGLEAPSRRISFAQGLLMLGTQSTVTLAMRFLDGNEVGEEAEWRFELHELLVEFAERHELADTPAWDECWREPYRAWTAWFREARDSLPTKLGRFELGASR